MNGLLCQVSGCGKNEASHRLTAHAFSPSADQLVSRGFKSTLPGVGPDPVLRVLLVKKGLIAAEELEDTEKELKAVGLLGGSGASYRSNGEPDRKLGENATT